MPQCASAMPIISAVKRRPSAHEGDHRKRSVPASTHAAPATPSSGARPRRRGSHHATAAATSGEHRHQQIASDPRGFVRCQRFSGPNGSSDQQRHQQQEHQREVRRADRELPSQARRRASGTACPAPPSRRRWSAEGCSPATGFRARYAANSFAFAVGAAGAQREQQQRPPITFPRKARDEHAAGIGGERVHAVIAPERTRKVPSSDSENAAMASSRVQWPKLPRFSVTACECSSAARARHEAGVLDRVPEPPAAPAEFVVGPPLPSAMPRVRSPRRRWSTAASSAPSATRVERVTGRAGGDRERERHREAGRSRRRASADARPCPGPATTD